MSTPDTITQAPVMQIRGRIRAQRREIAKGMPVRGRSYDEKKREQYGMMAPRAFRADKLTITSRLPQSWHLLADANFRPGETAIRTYLGTLKRFLLSSLTSDLKSDRNGRTI